MKHLTSIVWTLLIVSSLCAFTYSSWIATPADKPSCQSAAHIAAPIFMYNLSSPCMNTITKENIHKAERVSDLIPDHRLQVQLKNNRISVRDVKLRLEEKRSSCNKLRSEKWNGNSFSEAQRNLLKSTDYSSTFFLEGYYTDNNLVEDPYQDRYFNYCMTVVPEHQASYKAGNNVFIDYLRTNAAATIATLQDGNLMSGSILFTVSKEGSLSGINLNSTCGYPSVDLRMLELIKRIPGDWDVATNGNGDSVDQSFVFTYGQGGC